METTSVRTLLATAVAPVAWGSTYLVTEQFLPADRPLFAALVRALPAGLLLLAFKRRLPRGDWWWRATVLGVLNIGLFFPLIFLAAYHLPGGLAATLQATSPLAVMAHGGGHRERAAGHDPDRRGPDRARRRRAAGAAVPGAGRHASASSGRSARCSSPALGFVLVKHWQAPVDMLTLVSWQLVVGGLVLLPVALLVEGPPPAVDARAIGGFVWLGLVGTVVAYVCWFHGLSRMAAGAVSLVGPGQPRRRHRPGRAVRRRDLRLGAGARHGAGPRRGAGGTDLGCEDGGVDRVRGRATAAVLAGARPGLRDLEGLSRSFVPGA